MTHTKDALKQAIEAIKNNAGNPERVYQLANAALKEALAQPAPVRDFEKAIDEYLDDYEMIGEDEDGRDACHSPTEGEKALIKDAIMGFDWPPAVQRKPLPPICHQDMALEKFKGFMLGWRAAEAAHGIKENT